MEQFRKLSKRYTIDASIQGTGEEALPFLFDFLFFNLIGT